MWWLFYNVLSIFTLACVNSLRLTYYPLQVGTLKQWLSHSSTPGPDDHHSAIFTRRAFVDSAEKWPYSVLVFGCLLSLSIMWSLWPQHIPDRKLKLHFEFMAQPKVKEKEAEGRLVSTGALPAVCWGALGTACRSDTVPGLPFFFYALVVREFITIRNVFSFIILASLDISRYVAKKFGLLDKILLWQNVFLIIFWAKMHLTRGFQTGESRGRGQANSCDPSMRAYFRNNLHLKS